MQAEPRDSAFDRLLRLLNRLPVAGRRVPLGRAGLYPQSFDRWLAAQAWRFGLLERAERRLLEASVRPGQVAVDVGANIGFHTLTLARLVGPGGVVHALEPDAENRHALERSLRELGAACVRLHALAAWSHDGELRLDRSEGNRGDHRTLPLDACASERSVLVRCAKLDTLCAEHARVDFVKLDAQGAELEILRGAADVVARSPGIRLLCEVCPPLLQRLGGSAQTLFDWTEAHGLVPHRVAKSGGLVATTRADAIVRAERSGFENLLFQRSSA